MPAAEIRELVDVLGAALVSDEAFERNLRTVLRELGGKDARIIARVLEPVSPSSATMVLPDELVHLRAVFYDDRQLDYLTHQQLRAVFGPDWRSRKGAPIAYTTEGESWRTIRLVPVPDRPSELPLIPLWSPLGADYPLGAIMVLAAELTDLPPAMLEWLDMWTALSVLALALAEDSPRRDVEMATVFDEAARALYPLIAPGRL